MTLPKKRRLSALEAKAPATDLTGLTATAAEINAIADISAQAAITVS